MLIYIKYLWEIIIWLGRIVIWFFYPWLLYSLIAFFFLIIYAILYLTITRCEVVYTGLACQLFGFTLTIIELSGKKRKFKTESMFVLFKKWIGSFPKLSEQKSYSHNAKGGAIIPPLEGAGFSFNSMSLEKRIEYLQKEMIALKNELTSSLRRVQRSLDLLENDLNHKIDSLNSKILICEELIRSCEVGGLHVSLVGIVFFVVGSICSTVPDLVLKVLLFFQWNPDGWWLDKSATLCAIF